MWQKVIGVAATIVLLGCSTARVIQKTQDTAIIEGRWSTKIEAKMKAEAKARELFGGFEHTKDPECSQGYSSSVSTDSAGKVSGSGSSYWSCVIYVERTGGADRGGEYEEDDGEEGEYEEDDGEGEYEDE